MYVGRLVAVGATSAGCASVLYRVSSRSFPNRRIVSITEGAAVVPNQGHEADLLKNPYIAYTGLKVTDRYAVASNGSHTEIIANKLLDGHNMRDSIAQVLTAMDFEHDSLNTPRIVAVAEPASRRGYLAVITHEELHVCHFELVPGKLWFVATYELNQPSPENALQNFYASNAETACAYVLEGEGGARFANPVSAAAAISGGGHWDIATKNLT